MTDFLRIPLSFCNFALQRNYKYRIGMKKLMICMFLALGAMNIYAKDIKKYVVTTTPQMSCQNCENKIKGNLRFEKGVKNVETSLKDQVVTVTYDAEKTDEAKLAEAFGKLNYKVKKVDGKADVKACSGKKCDGKSNCCDKKSESSCENKKD